MVGSSSLCVCKPFRGFSCLLKCDNWSNTLVWLWKLSGDDGSPREFENGVIITRGILGE